MSTETKKRKRGVAVSMKELVKVLVPVIENPDEDPEKNMQRVVAECGLTPSTIKQKISAYRKQYPQFRMLDTSCLTRGGYRKEIYSEKELNEFFAKMLGKSAEEVAEFTEEVTADRESE